MKLDIVNYIVKMVWQAKHIFFLRSVSKVLADCNQTIVRK